MASAFDSLFGGKKDDLSEVLKEVLGSAGAKSDPLGGPTGSAGMSQSVGGAMAKLLHDQNDLLGKQKVIMEAIDELKSPERLKDQLNLEKEFLKVQQELANAELERQKVLAEARAKDPEYLRQQVELEIKRLHAVEQLEKAQRQLNAAMAEQRVASLPEAIPLTPEEEAEHTAAEQKAVDKPKKPQQFPVSQREETKRTITFGEWQTQKGEEEYEKRRLQGEMPKGAAGMGKTAGSAVGFAMGGPIGGEIGSKVGEVVGEAVGQIPEVIAKPIQMVNGLFKGLNANLKELNSTLGPINVGFDMVTASLKGVGDMVRTIPAVDIVLGPIIDAFTALPGILKDLLDTLTQFGAVASPSAMKALKFAVDDVMGVIGQAFVPVMFLMRDVIRTIGDVIANVIPNMSEMFAAIAPLRQLFDEVSVAVKGAVSEMGPALREMFSTTVHAVSTALYEMKPVLFEFGNALKDMIQELGPLIQSGFVIAMRAVIDVFSTLIRVATYASRVLVDFLKSLGLVTKTLEFKKTGEADRSSWGAAARQAQFSDFDQYRKQLQLTAFTEARSTGPEAVPKMVKDISDHVGEIAEALMKLTPLDIAAAIAKTGIRIISDAAEAAAGGAGDATVRAAAPIFGGPIEAAVTAAMEALRARTRGR